MKQWHLDTSLFPTVSVKEEVGYGTHGVYYRPAAS